MGASKQRLVQMKQSFPFCAFCCGDNPTTSIEHMPSRILFDGKDRPKGLEFPSCQPCQDATRKEEQAIAMFSRIYPDPVSEEARRELWRIIHHVRITFPGLMESMWVDQVPALNELGADAFKLPQWNFLSLSGDQCKSVIDKFGVKLAKALHLEKTGQIVPHGAGIYVQPYSNVQAVLNQLPQDFIALLGDAHTLTMGAKHAWETFEYQSISIEDTNHSGHMAYFRKSFALLMLVYPDATDVPDNAREWIIYT